MGKFIVFIAGYLFWPFGACLQIGEWSAAKKIVETRYEFLLLCFWGCFSVAAIIGFSFWIGCSNVSRAETWAWSALEIAAVAHLLGYAAYLFCKCDREIELRLQMSNTQTDDSMTTM